MTSEPQYKVAFYTYRSTIQPANLPQHHTLIFDTVKKNLGQGYHEGDGTFIVPTTGLYVFSWTVALESDGWANVEIVVNTEVFLRMHENGRGVLHSSARGRTSFSGWRIQ